MLWLETSDLPTSVVINDQEYFIRTDFRTWVRVDSILQDRAIAPEVKLPIVCLAIGLDLNNCNETQQDLWAGIKDFYLCGKEPKDAIGAQTNGRQGYRFDQDIGMVYSAFRQQYNINLLTANLHWFEFKALFDSLNEDTMMVKVIGYRTRSLNGLKGEERKRAQRLERYWRLPDDSPLEHERTPQEIEAELLAKLES